MTTSRRAPSSARSLPLRWPISRRCNHDRYPARNKHRRDRPDGRRAGFAAHRMAGAACTSPAHRHDDRRDREHAQRRDQYPRGGQRSDRQRARGGAVMSAIDDLEAAIKNLKVLVDVTTEMMIDCDYQDHKQMVADGERNIALMWIVR